MALSLSKTGPVFLMMAILALPAVSHAEDAQFRIGTAILGDLKYAPGFKHFDYVNPDAPKGGDLKLSADGTFDTFNPVLKKGETAEGLSLVFDTLLKSSDDETSSAYGLLAEGVAYPDDISSATFRLRSEAKWADGTPVTPEDVIYSFDKTKELDPVTKSYYAHVTKAEKTGDRDVTFSFDEKGNRQLPWILGQFLIVPKLWWEANGSDGKPRDISRTTLEPVMGSGPYKIAAFSPGSTIRYELRDDYWGKNLPVNVGENNFGTIAYTYYGDSQVKFEAFRAGNTDFRQEQSASKWATAYDFQAIKDGRILREQVANPLRSRGIMQAFVPNLRRDQFKDEKVREALNYAFDFEDLNRNLAYNAFQRIDSYFWGTELASSALPQGRELEILNEVRDKVPPKVFTTPYTNPVGGDPQKMRENFRKAIALLKEAGWELRGNNMVNVATGKPLSFEILLQNQSYERTVLPFANNLKKIGIEARLRTVDTAQYTSRIRSFDYDMIYGIWSQSVNPGNEQNSFWGSKAANLQGTQNYAGIADPGVDALIAKVVQAQNREEKNATARALDRVLLAHHYVIPLFYSSTVQIAYSNRLARPASYPEYSVGFPDVWWSKSP
ncbi:extracellular solute-binding protein [Rhizobium tumorigenes]|uniref:extracellular solute-binding protein n=1 Tax=Rhizobium tumorigenes TaxID=2041385 RepID=UPI00241EBB20|nr:extracellular solute-binding protein [Rhizobium tumorigenes]WFS00815.1 extracellular solute-binding protein [Rhizobium tumorigenes]